MEPRETTLAAAHEGRGAWHEGLLLKTKGVVFPQPSSHVAGLGGWLARSEGWGTCREGRYSVHTA